MANPAGAFQFFDSTKTAAKDTTLKEGTVKTASTVIGADVVLKGNLKSAGDVVIEGVFEGDLTCDGRVTIAAGATLIGSANAAEVLLGGKVKGNSVATKSLSLLGTAEVRGDVTTPQIHIEPGATFVGRCTMPQSE